MTMEYPTTKILLEVNSHTMPRIIITKASNTNYVQFQSILLIQKDISGSTLEISHQKWKCVFQDPSPNMIFLRRKEDILLVVEKTMTTVQCQATGLKDHLLHLFLN